MNCTGHAGIPLVSISGRRREILRSKLLRGAAIRNLRRSRTAHAPEAFDSMSRFLPPATDPSANNGAATSVDFSLHAGIEIRSGQRAKLEHLCRYVSRPSPATERLTIPHPGECATSPRPRTATVPGTSCWSRWICRRDMHRSCRYRGGIWPDFKGCSPCTAATCAQSPECESACGRRPAPCRSRA